MTKEEIDFDKWYNTLFDLVTKENADVIIEYSVAQYDYEMGMTPEASCNLFINQKR